MTVAEVFRKAGLSLHGPVRWGKQMSESRPGVYVVARVGSPAAGCRARGLPFKDPLPPNLVLDPRYERKRWLPDEPVLHIGQTTRSLRKPIGQFYRQEVGNRGPHAGGQVVKLLGCERSVYWSPTTHPREFEKKMISVFKNQVCKLPFANGEPGKPKRIRCSN